MLLVTFMLGCLLDLVCVYLGFAGLLFVGFVASALWIVF